MSTVIGAYWDLPGVPGPTNPELHAKRIELDAERLQARVDAGIAAYNLQRAPGQVSDGSSADYYKLPAESTQLQDLISARDMNAQMGEIFRAVYRYGQVAHSPKLRDAKKILYYIQAEIARLEKLEV
jgi:hypothetical protein